MPTLPPPSSVTLLPPSSVMTVRALPPCHGCLQLCVLHVRSVLVILIVTGLGPQLNLILPPVRTAAYSFFSVHEAGVPVPTTLVFTGAVATARPSAPVCAVAASAVEAFTAAPRARASAAAIARLARRQF